MQQHKPSVKNEKRWELIMTATDRMDHDGLINIKQVSKVISIKEFYKFTHILADVDVK